MRFLLIFGLFFVALCAETLCAVDENRMYFPDEEDYLRIKANTDSSKRAIEAVTTAADAFAVNFFKAVAKTDSGNFVCSPISMSIILSLLSYGAAGNTRVQMRTALQFPTDDNLARSGFRNLVESLSKYKTVNLKVASRIFVDNDIDVKPRFNEIATKVFNSSAATVDFLDEWAASGYMSGWCEKQTNNYIKNIIKPNDVTSSMKVVLLNAVYFKGKWSTKFNPENTKKRTFWVNGVEAKEVMTMETFGKFRMGALLDAQANIIELPYKIADAAQNVSMFIIIPWQRNGLAKLEENFEKVTMREVQRNLQEASMMRVFLPKFKIESTIHLEPHLKTMGMNNLFHQADLSEFTDQTLNVDKVIQKAIIEIDEESSETSEATPSADPILTTGNNDNSNIYVAHPFIVVIGTVSNDPINLFTARFTG